jgi:hypothetical protein
MAELTFGEELISPAIFVCAHCKKLTLIPRDLWTSESDSLSSTAPARRRGQNQLIGNSTYILYQGISKYRFRGSYNQMLEDFKKRQCTDFPFCSNCINLLCPRWRYETQYLTEQTAYLARLSLPDALARYQELEKMNARLANDVSAFQEVARQYTSDIAKISHPMSTTNRTSDDALGHPLVSARPVPQDPPPLACRQLPFSGLAFATTYRITTKRHYGCINDNRLGLNCPDVVPPEEVDRAFFFVAHMVQALGRLAGVATRELAVGAGVSLKDDDGSVTVLTATDLKSRKGIKAFETGVRLLVGVVHRIFDSDTFAQSDFSPPHRVEMGRREVAGDSFVFDRKKPEVFTAAMKHLLFNLKYTQKWALQAGVRAAADEERRAAEANK